MSLRQMLDDASRSPALRVDAALAYGRLPTATVLILVRKWAWLATVKSGWSYHGMSVDFAMAERSPKGYYEIEAAVTLAHNAAVAAQYQSNRYSVAARFASDAIAFYFAAAGRFAHATLLESRDKLHAAHDFARRSAVESCAALSAKHGPSFAVDQLADVRRAAEGLGLVGARELRPTEESRANFLRGVMTGLDLL